MKIGDLIHKELVLAELTAPNKNDVLYELIEPLRQLRPEIDIDEAHKVLLEREDLGTTGIGDGIAIPHGKLAGLDEIILVVGRSVQGIDFDALDFKPCNIFFLVLAPDQAAGMHLRILAQISKMLKDPQFKESFLKAGTQEELYQLVQTI